jgi:deoxyinosine 3'endonuclease (endonuclease V)
MKHAENWNGNDVTLCGLANEAGDDGEVTGETVNPGYASPGGRVTCPECLRAIQHVIANYGQNGRVKVARRESRP